MGYIEIPKKVVCGLQCNIFNIGGGPEFALSIWREFESLLKELSLPIPTVQNKKLRQGDQKVYVSDTCKAESFFQWKPKTPPSVGITLLNFWLKKFFQNDV